jgi:hypothetical protein
MTDRSDLAYGTGGPSAYAPRRAQQSEATRRRVMRPADDRGFAEPQAEPAPEPKAVADWGSGGDLVKFTNLNHDVAAADRPTDRTDSAPEDDAYINRVRARMSTDPVDADLEHADLRHTLRLRTSQRGMLAPFGRLILAVTIAAIAALVISGKLANWRNVVAGQGPAEAAIAPTRAEPGVEGSLPLPQLVAVQSSVRGSSEELPLALEVEGPDAGVALLVTGLPAGASVTTGREVANGWRVAAADIARTMLRRPPGFVGPMDLILELRLPDETVADRRSWRLEWIAPPAAASSPVTVPAPAAAMPAEVKDGGAQRADIVAAQPSDKPARALDAATIATLMRRADELVTVGDMSAARLLLRRAAEAQDSRAAFALAATYDPIVLEKRGVRGGIADITLARMWYDKAREFGSPEAQQRIEKLATVH